MNNNLRLALIIGGVILVVLIILSMVFGGNSGWGGYGYGMMGNFGWMWFMPVVMIIFWGLVIWGIVALVRGSTWSSGAGPSQRTDSALEILQKRYARGEINKEEYEEKKKDLS